MGGGRGGLSVNIAGNTAVHLKCSQAALNIIKKNPSNLLNILQKRKESWPIVTLNKI